MRLKRLLAELERSPMKERAMDSMEELADSIKRGGKKRVKN